MASQLDSTFVPALIVVDMQEDFCPPVITLFFLYFLNLQH